MSTTVDPPAPTLDEDAGEIVGEGARQEVTTAYVRSPRDVLRLAVFAVISLVLLGLTLGVDDAVLAFEEDVVGLFGFLTPTIERIVQGGLEILVLAASLIVYLVPLFTRRYRLFGYVAAASSSAYLLMTLVTRLVDRVVSAEVTNEIADRAGVNDDVVAGVIGLSQLAAAFIVVGPFVSRRWRRAGAVTIAVALVGQLLVSISLPVEAFVALPIGASCGAAMLLAFGRPDRRPTEAGIVAALADAGLEVGSVRAAAVDARGSTPYFATTAEGDGLFVKVLGGEERAADLLFRVYRFLRFKDVGDGRPFSSLRRTVEHEALVALLARDLGVRTPRLRGVVGVGSDSMLLAYDLIDGRSLDSLAPEAIDDDVLRALWVQVGLMHSRRIAHRDLRLANVFLASDGRPWIIDFGFSEAAATGELLDADVAQLMASSATVVGVERAVAAAVDALGSDAVGRALPRLQMSALSGSTQSALRSNKGLLDRLQHEVIEQCGVEQVEYAELDRVTRRTVIMLVALGLAVYFLVPQLSDLPGIIDQISEANWGWAPLVVLFSAMTYIAAAMALEGAVPQRVPAGPTVMASVGSSFASKLAPAGLGGMALNVRFLQKQGVDKTVAVSSVGLNTVAGLVGHVLLIVVFLVWAGREAFGGLSLPDPKWFLIGIGIALGMVALGLLVRPLRQMMLDRLLPILHKALGGVRTVLRTPGKLALLIGGSMLVTFSYICTLYFSTQAFGGGLAFAGLGAVYLVGSAVAQAAPTPGGLGAMEAALIGGMVAAGLDNTVAVPAVFLFRLATFWLPILPGWFAFQWLQRNDHL
jgi:uncharacterized membrane protein YbhN (UPF0104 family)/tRNA A-37 threonylcarbamoyl transferase component Bud32